MIIKILSSASNFEGIDYIERKNDIGKSQLLKASNFEALGHNYLNNIIEHVHRFIKWRISNGLGYRSIKSANVTLSGIETVQMIKKNQLNDPGRTPFNSSYS